MPRARLWGRSPGRGSDTRGACRPLDGRQTLGGHAHVLGKAKRKNNTGMKNSYEVIKEKPEGFGVEIFIDPVHRPYRACFKIGVQTFYVCEREDIKEAEWFVRQLTTAFEHYAFYLGHGMAEMLQAKHKELEALKAENKDVVKGLERIAIPLAKHAFTAGRGTDISWYDFAKREKLL